MATAQEIDREVRKLCDDAYQRAKDLLVKHRDTLEYIAKALLEFETLDGNQIRDIIKYGKPAVGLGEKETAIIKFGRETFGQRKVSSETFAQVLSLFGRKGTVDLLWVMANYSAAAAELIAFDNQLRADQKPLLPAR